MGRVILFCKKNKHISETGFIVSANRLPNVTLVDPDSYTVVARGVADLYP